MEHDKLVVLFGLTLDWLRVEHVVQPGITVIEPAVPKAREQTWDETFDRLSLGLSDEQVEGPDQLLEIRHDADVSTLTWPTSTPTAATTYTPSKPRETANSGHPATPDHRFCSVTTATPNSRLAAMEPTGQSPAS